MRAADTQAGRQTRRQTRRQTGRQAGRQKGQLEFKINVMASARGQIGKSILLSLNYIARSEVGAAHSAPRKHAGA